HRTARLPGRARVPAVRARPGGLTREAPGDTSGSRSLEVQRPCRLTALGLAGRFRGQPSRIADGRPRRWAPSRLPLAAPPHRGEGFRPVLHARAAGTAVAAAP